MAGPQKRRSSTKQSSNQENIKDEPDIDLRNPFAPVDTSDTNDESEVSEYGKKGRKRPIKNNKTKRKSARAKPARAPSPPMMSDVEYGRDHGSPELGDCIEVKKPTTPKQAVSEAKRLTLQTHGQGFASTSSGTPSVVQIHLNAGASAGGTTINLNLSDLVLGKRTFGEIGAASLPTPDGSDGPPSPTRVVINNRTGQIKSATLEPSSKRLRMLRDADARVQPSRQSKKGFCDVPFELRVR